MKSSLFEHYKKKYGSGGKKFPVRKTGMWYQEGDVVVPSNEITMKGPNGEKDYFDSPIMGIGMQSGESQVMLPGEDYFFPKDDAVLETKMQKGGIRTSLDNISPEGDVSYSATARKGPLSLRAASQTNLLTGKQQLISPTLSGQFGNLSLSATPTTFSADYQGSKGYASMFRDAENKSTDFNAGLNLGNFNLDANAFVEGSSLKNIGAAARYQATPNLAFTGNINYNPEEGTPNYNVGFTYSKKFQGGGMAIPGVNGVVVSAMPTTIRDAYKKKKKKK